MKVGRTVIISIVGILLVAAVIVFSPVFKKLVQEENLTHAIEKAATLEEAEESDRIKIQAIQNKLLQFIFSPNNLREKRAIEDFVETRISKNSELFTKLNTVLDKKIVRVTLGDFGYPQSFLLFYADNEEPKWELTLNLGVSDDNLIFVLSNLEREMRIIEKSEMYGFWTDPNLLEEAAGLTQVETFFDRLESNSELSNIFQYAAEKKVRISLSDHFEVFAGGVYVDISADDKDIVRKLNGTH